MSERSDTAYAAWKEAHCKAAEADFRMQLGQHLAQPCALREAQRQEVAQLKRLAAEKLQRFLEASHPGSGQASGQASG